MKKLLSLLLIVLLLVGCSNSGVSTISNADDIIFRIEDKEITRGTIYNMLRFQNIAPEIAITEAQKVLISSKVEQTAEIEEKAQENLDSARATFGDYFETRYGTGTDEELLEDIFIPATLQQQFLEQEYETNTDKIIEESKPVKVHVLYFDTEQQAKDALEALNNDEEIAGVIAEFGSAQAGLNNAEPTIVAKGNLPELVQTYLDSNEPVTDEWSKQPIVDVNASYLVKPIELDSTLLVEEYRDIFLTDQVAVSNLMNEAFKNARFEVYDQAIYDAIKNNEQLQHFEIDN